MLHDAPSESGVKLTHKSVSPLKLSVLSMYYIVCTTECSRMAVSAGHASYVHSLPLLVVDPSGLVLLWTVG